MASGGATQGNESIQPFNEKEATFQGESSPKQFIDNILHMLESLQQDFNEKYYHD